MYNIYLELFEPRLNNAEKPRRPKNYNKIINHKTQKTTYFLWNQYHPSRRNFDGEGALVLLLCIA